MADIRLSQLPAQGIATGNHLVATTGTVTFKVLANATNTASTVVIRDASGNAGFNGITGNTVTAVNGNFSGTVTAGFLKGDGSQLTNLPVSDGVPVGTIILYGSIFPPDNYVTCDGRALSRSTYNSLYSIIGTSFGSGDGSTTFNVPDMRGRVPVGVGAGAGLTNRVMATRLGAETHQLTANESGLRDHTHRQSYGGCFRSAGGCESSNRSAQGGSSTAGSLTTQGVNGGAQNALTAHNNMQPSIVLAYYIKLT